MPKEIFGCVAFGTSRGANTRYKMEKKENIEEKRMKLIEGGVERCGPLRCQFTTARSQE